MVAGEATPKETQTKKPSARHTQEHKHRGNNTKVEKAANWRCVFECFPTGNFTFWRILTLTPSTCTKTNKHLVQSNIQVFKPAQKKLSSLRTAENHLWHYIFQWIRTLHCLLLTSSKTLYLRAQNNNLRLKIILDTQQITLWMIFLRLAPICCQSHFILPVLRMMGHEGLH